MDFLAIYLNVGLVILGLMFLLWLVSLALTVEGTGRTTLWLGDATGLYRHDAGATAAAPFSWGTLKAGRGVPAPGVDPLAPRVRLKAGDCVPDRREPVFES